MLPQVAEEPKDLQVELQEKSLFLFDVGNTLLHLDFELLMRLACRFGAPCNQTQFLEAEARAREQVDQASLQGVELNDEGKGRLYFTTLFRTLGVAEKYYAEMESELRRANAEFTLWSILLPGTEEVLQSLRDRGNELGIVSNSDGKLNERLRRAQLEGYFQLIVDSSEVGVEKPDPAIFYRALSFFEKEPREAFYVGDLYSVDICGANAAGIAAALLDPYGYYLHPSCPTIASLEELILR